MAMETVLLLEGINAYDTDEIEWGEPVSLSENEAGEEPAKVIGGEFEMGELAGRERTCIRTQNVYSPATGGYVKRCAEYAPARRGLFGFGDETDEETARKASEKTLGIDTNLLVKTAITGGFATGGAWLAKQISDWLSEVGKSKEDIKAGENNFNPEGNTADIIQIGIGVLIGGLVTKYAKQPKIGYAIGIGPIVMVGLKLMGQIAFKTSTTSTSGLGLITATPMLSPQPFTLPPIERFPLGDQLYAERRSSGLSGVASLV